MYNKYNVNHLKGMATIWKDGFQDALRDLLLRVREYKPINMSNLLKNMSILNSRICLMLMLVFKITA